MTRVAWLLATWFGCGLSPVAPGTAGTLGALIILPFAYYFHWPPAVFGLLAMLLFLPGVWAATVTARATNRKDPGLVVVDEVAGLWLTLAGAPNLTWPWIVAAFALFRLFDVWKPAPARQLESLPEGWGIMADDMMAGIYGALALLVMQWFNRV